jgi:membrane protease subunit HflC
MVADATAKSEQIRGEGDSERNRIFADAFNRDPDFFSFYRSMQAYEASMHKNDTRMLLKPDSDFFRYFANPSGAMRNAPPPTGSTTPPPPRTTPQTQSRVGTSGAAAGSTPTEPIPAGPR